MQSQEFDKLMAGQPAKWADVTDLSFKPFTKKPTIQQRKDAKEEIERVEKPIPENIKSEIYRFINKEREKGTKERTIRRMVQRKWNIKVI